MKRVISLTGAILISFMAWAYEEITGKVVTVIDGNTIEVAADDKDNYIIILHGIDCPELGQEYGEKAKKLLEKLVLKKYVKIQIQGKDRKGNRLGILLLNEKEDPRFELLSEGLAWTSEKNPIEELEVVKEKAREKNKGLWKESNPIPPWTYRRQQSMMQAKSS